MADQHVRDGEGGPHDAGHPRDGGDAHCGDRAPGRIHHGRNDFGLALLAVRLINAGMFMASSSHDEAELATAIRRLAPGLLIGPAVIAAAFTASPYRELLWIAAAVIDFGSPLLLGSNGLRVVPSYFIERHGLVIIIALGEAIVALGAVASETCATPAS
jgi:low temperature requirement protein LtrA